MVSFRFFNYIHTYYVLSFLIITYFGLNDSQTKYVTIIPNIKENNMSNVLSIILCLDIIFFFFDNIMLFIVKCVYY